MSGYADFDYDGFINDEGSLDFLAYEIGGYGEDNAVEARSQSPMQETTTTTQGAEQSTAGEQTAAKVDRVLPTLASNGSSESDTFRASSTPVAQPASSGRGRSQSAEGISSSPSSSNESRPTTWPSAGVVGRSAANLPSQAFHPSTPPSSPPHLTLDAPQAHSLPQGQPADSRGGRLLGASTSQPPPSVINHQAAPAGFSYPGQTDGLQMLSSDHGFWKQRATLYNDRIKAPCHGTYAELHAAFAELRGIVMNRLQAWRIQQKHTQDEDVKPAYPQSQLLDGSMRMKGFSNSPTSNYPTSTQSGLHPQATQSAARTPLRDVTVNGRNDGTHCTRCFNAINKARELQNEELRQRIFQQQQPASRPLMPKPPVANATSAVDANFVPHQTASLDYGLQIDGAVSWANLPVNASPTMIAENGAHSMAAQQPGPGSALNDASGSPEIDMEHTSVAAARDYIDRPPARDCKQLELENDDWNEIRSEKFDDVCQQLYRALNHPPSQAPHYFSPAERLWYNRNHNTTYNAVLRELQTPEQLSLAKARVILAMDEVIATNEIGVPKIMIARSEQKSHRGYEPQENLTCGQRVHKVIEYVRGNKYVALDVLRGLNMREFTVSPDKYVIRKYDNAQTNAARGSDLRSMKAIRNNQLDPNEVANQGPRKRGRKPKATFVANPAPMEYSDPTTPTFASMTQNGMNNGLGNGMYPPSTQAYGFQNMYTPRLTQGDPMPSSSVRTETGAQKRSYDDLVESTERSETWAKRARVDDGDDDEDELEYGDGYAAPSDDEED
ncbi:hypothetical protein LTR37_003410 [Vermiconidia calcicola]|uniref:Uncharacterized protein n=1 Tax=Vermiconidia calcicola TaxID=1690605 RepID=A0ACC3NRZ6_9PEZI|nr:hypothetical protein LTR37_003410 [Vermiconidia calcicola]